MRKLFDLLTSTRSAVILMAAVVLLVLLSAIVPQQGFESGRLKDAGGIIEALQPVMRSLALDRIYGSALFLGLLALLGLGLLAGSLRRLGQVGRLRNPAARARLLGSVVFHFAMVVILAGAMLNRSFKFEGAFGLTEGQQVADDPRQYVRSASGGLRSESFGRFQVRLNRIEREHPAGETTTEAADLTVTRGTGLPGVEGMVAINAPLRLDDLEFHLGSLVGYSPEIVFLDDTGVVLQQAFVRVGGHRTAPGRIVHEDFIDSPVAGQKLSIRIEPAGFPEHAPEIVLSVVESEVELYSGVTAVGDTLRLGELRVAVPRLRRWCYIEVVENPWIGLVFAGFWIGLAGLTLSAVARVLPSDKLVKESQEGCS